MKIQYCSDLHLEFIKNTIFLHSNLLIPSADILILAGDIIPFRKSLDKVKYFDFLSESFQQVYWLPGNHEYYNSDMVRGNVFKGKKVRDNVHIVNNEIISINDVNLIFSTLWSQISPQRELIIKSSLSDFSQIKNDGKAFSPKHFNILHQESLRFLENSLIELNGNKNLVVTHHVPTLLNYPKAYLTSPINEAFAVELYDLIEKYQPDAWIYGHSHVNTPDFTNGKTRLVTNQLGYVDMNEHHTFVLNKFIEI
jgi:predicted phosphohydrolase